MARKKRNSVARDERNRETGKLGRRCREILLAIGGCGGKVKEKKIDSEKEGQRREGRGGGAGEGICGPAEDEPPQGNRRTYERRITTAALPNMHNNV